MDLNTGPPFLGRTQPVYPPLLQLVRVTAATVPGPSGGYTSSSILAALLYVGFTEQLRTDTILPRDREPCLVADPNGAGLTPGYYLGRLAGAWTGLPVYEVGRVGGGVTVPTTFSGPVTINGPLTVNGPTIFNSTVEYTSTSITKFDHFSTLILDGPTVNITRSTIFNLFSSTTLTISGGPTTSIVIGIGILDLSTTNTVILPGRPFACKLATIAPLPANTYNNGASGVGATLTMTANGTITVDGGAVNNNDRVLVNDELDQTHNGPYTCTQQGSGGTPCTLTRATDADTPTKLFGGGVDVIAGATYAGTRWLLNATVAPNIGTSVIVYEEICCADAGDVTNAQLGPYTLNAVVRYASSLPTTLGPGSLTDDLSTVTVTKMLALSDSGGTILMGTVNDYLLPNTVVCNFASGNGTNYGFTGFSAPAPGTTSFRIIRNSADPLTSNETLTLYDSNGSSLVGNRIVCQNGGTNVVLSPQQSAIVWYDAVGGVARWYVLGVWPVPATAISGIIPTTGGGTGLATLTAHALLLGEGSSNAGFASPGSAGGIVISQGSTSDPAFINLSGNVASLSASGTLLLNSLDTLPAPAASLSMATHKITNVVDPAAAQDAATKNYVDMAVAALASKNDAQTITTAPLAAYTYNNGASGVGATITLTVATVLVVGGYTPTLNDRVVVSKETGGNAPYNGIYSLTTVGVLGVTQAVLTRTLDFDQPGDGINGALVAIISGTQAGTLWYSNAYGTITFGTTNITWTQFQGTTYTGDEVTVHLAGTTFSIKGGYLATIATTGAITDATGTLLVTHGGTGLAMLTNHALQVGAGTSTPTQLGLGTSTTVLHGGGGDPTWGAVALTTDVSGILPVVSGGWGLATLTAHAVYVGAGTSVPTALAVGATNTLLHGNTGADPSWSAVVEADITLADNATNNVSTAKHGFAPKSPNDATKYLDGTGTYSVPPSGGGGGVGTVTSVGTGSGLTGGTITSSGVLSLNTLGLSSAYPGFPDTAVEYNAVGAANRRILLSLLGGLMYPGLWQARLTLTPGVPVTNTDVTAGTSVYCTPMTSGNRGSLYDGNGWNEIPIAEASLPLSQTQSGTTVNGTKNITGLTSTQQLVRGMNVTGTGVGASATITAITSATAITVSSNSTASSTNTLTFALPNVASAYDVWGILSAGALRTQLGNIWTSTLIRADALGLQDGVYVNSTIINSADSNAIPAGSRYLGSLLIGAAGMTGTVGQVPAANDSVLNRCVWNMYNRRQRQVRLQQGVASSATLANTNWTYYQSQSTTFINFILGLAEDAVHLRAAGAFGGPASGDNYATGIGIDSSTVNSADLTTFGGTTSIPVPAVAEYNGLPSIGAHVVAQLQKAQVGSFAGTAYGTLSPLQAGLTGFVVG